MATAAPRLSPRSFRPSMIRWRIWSRWLSRLSPATSASNAAVLVLGGGDERPRGLVVPAHAGERRARLGADRPVRIARARLRQRLDRVGSELGQRAGGEHAADVALVVGELRLPGRARL